MVLKSQAVCCLISGCNPSAGGTTNADVTMGGLATSRYTSCVIVGKRTDSPRLTHGSMDPQLCPSDRLGTSFAWSGHGQVWALYTKGLGGGNKSNLGFCHC